MADASEPDEAIAVFRRNHARDTQTRYCDMVDGNQEGHYDRADNTLGREDVYEKKKAKYDEWKADCEYKGGWKAWFTPVDIGCIGYVAQTM